MRDEPALTAATVSAIGNAFLAMLISLNIVSLTGEQQASVLAFVNIIAPFVVAWWVKRRTTPLAHPQDAQGRKLEPVQPAKPVTRGLDE